MKTGVVEAVEELLKTKVDNGSIQTLNEEAQFLCGAMCVLNQLYGSEDKLAECIPPGWCLGALSGRSVVDAEYEDEAVAEEDWEGEEEELKNPFPSESPAYEAWEKKHKGGA